MGLWCGGVNNPVGRAVSSDHLTTVQEVMFWEDCPFFISFNFLRDTSWLRLGMCIKTARIGSDQHNLLPRPNKGDAFSLVSMLSIERGIFLRSPSNEKLDKYMCYEVLSLVRCDAKTPSLE